MKRGAGKAFEAREFWVARDVQRSHARDKHAGANSHSIAGESIPNAFGFIPNRFLKTRVEAQIRSKLIAFDAALQVVVDFLLARIHAGPFRGWRERKRIEVGRDIAGAAGVAIVPPGAANLAALFYNEKRFHAGFEKLDAHANG